MLEAFCAASNSWAMFNRLNQTFFDTSLNRHADKWADYALFAHNLKEARMRTPPLKPWLWFIKDVAKWWLCMKVHSQ